ncbi:MAG TPA: hypothetical protein EYO73_11040 [Sulfurimonas sp.]|nr:hypothetical protein [Sulfurimonas sp.]
MFDFMDSDWFIIGLEVVFLSFIAYDGWKFYKTRKKEYIMNIVLAIGFALWVLVPFYTKYYDWSDTEREGLSKTCLSENNASYCTCMNNMIEKEYTHKQYEDINKKDDKDYLDFVKDSKEECFGDSWF